MKHLGRRALTMLGLAVLLAAGLFCGAALSGGPSSAGAVAATTIGAVTCDLPQFNPTHFSLQPGQTVTCTISDPDLIVNGPVNVNIQSTDFVNTQSLDFGNTTVVGTGDAASHTITFTYTGSESGCNTSAITFDKGANGGGGGVVSTGAGFAFVTSSGELIVCGQGTTTTG